MISIPFQGKPFIITVIQVYVPISNAAEAEFEQFYEDLGVPGGSDGKESACSAGDLGSIPGMGRTPGEGNSYPLQYSGLENSMDCIVHGVAKNWARLSDFH